MTPVVTAVITTYNRAAFLARAIESVLHQTFADLELLVFDNGSTDGTGSIVRQFTDHRLEYIVHPPMTVAAARNLGLERARGSYVGYLDDDDEWLPPKLEQQLKVFRQSSPDVALVYGGFARIDATGRVFAHHVPTLRGRILTSLLWQRDPFTGSASNPLMKVDAMRELGGYNIALHTSEDWELYLRLAERYAVDHTRALVVRIRAHGAPRLGDRIADACAVEEMVLNRYAGIMAPRLRSYYLQKIGGKLYRTGAVRAGRRRLRDAIVTYPLNLVAYAQYGLSYLGPGLYAGAHRFYRRFIAG